MLESQQYFLTAAGLALALAGFSSVVASLRGNQSTRTPQDIAGLLFIFELTFCACFFALMPVSLYVAGVADSVNYKIAGGLLTACVLTILSMQVARIKVLRSMSRSARMERWLIFGLLPSLVVVSVLTLYASFCAESVWGLAVAIYWLLFCAGAQFFVFLWKGINLEFPDQ